MSFKGTINDNAKWLRYGSIILAFTIFVIAQSTAGGKKTEKIDNLEKADIEIKQDIDNVEEDIQQIKLDINSIQKDVGYTKDDVADIKKDQKEILKILYQIKDK